MEPDAELLGDDPVRLRRGRRDREPPPESPPSAEPGARSYRPLLILAVVVLAALVASTAWHADRQARAHESAALAACREKLHNATVSADLTLVAVADNLRPTLVAARGEQRARVERTMSNPARQLLPEVAEAARTCRAVSVLPWHLALHGRHEATVAYSSALATKVRRIAADGREFYRDEPALRRLRRAADVGVIGGRY